MPKQQTSEIRFIISFKEHSGDYLPVTIITIFAQGYNLCQLNSLPAVLMAAGERGMGVSIMSSR